MKGKTLVDFAGAVSDALHYLQRPRAGVDRDSIPGRTDAEGSVIGVFIPPRIRLGVRRRSTY